MCDPPEPVVLEQRERYREAARDLVLPAFMIRDGKEWRLVHYEADILSRVPWDEVDLRPLFHLPLGAGNGRDTALRTGLDEERRPLAPRLCSLRAGYGGGPRGCGRPDAARIGGRVRRDRLLLRGQPPAGRDAQPLAGPRGDQAGLRRAARPASAGAGRRELRVRPRTQVSGFISTGNLQTTH